MASLKLVKEEDGCQSFLCPVKLSSSDYYRTRLKNMGRFRNALHFDLYFVKTTVYDALDELKEKYSRLPPKRSREVLAAQVAHEFGGTAYLSEGTLKQEATTAHHFHDRSIEENGSIQNEDNRKVTFDFLKMRNSEAFGLPMYILIVGELRRLKRFINIFSIKLGTPFVNGR